VLDELAILTRPGAVSRRKEIESIRIALAPYRELSAIEPPGTLDGGDVLRLGRNVYVGLSSRTNASGFDQLRALLEPRGYSVHGVPVTACLHLKSAVTQVAEETVLLRSDWVRPDTFIGCDRIEVDPSEPYAANALLVGGVVICPSAYPRTRDRLEQRGARIVEVEVTELLKAEGAVTCCSIVFVRTKHPPGT
jgi:dimethylargininase